MRMTSNRELARRIGVTETAVRRAEKAGRIKREPDGSWDPAKVKAAWSDNTDQAQQRPAGSGRPAVKRRALKPVPEAAVGAVRDTLREHGEPIVAGAMTFMQARTANEVLKAQERRLRLQQMKGELVDRAKAVAQVFRLARDERDAWVNWPARVAAVIGIAIVPASATRSERLRSVHLEGLDLTRTVAVYGVAGRKRSPVATMLLNLLRAADWSRYVH
jgi:hypothetical protein